MASVICGAVTTLIGLIVGFAYGAVWANKRTRRCQACQEERVCPKCGKITLVV